MGTVVLVVLFCLALVEGKALESRGKRSADDATCGWGWNKFLRERMDGKETQLGGFETRKIFWECIYRNGGMFGRPRTCFENDSFWMSVSDCTGCLRAARNG